MTVHKDNAVKGVCPDFANKVSLAGISAEDSCAFVALPRRTLKVLSKASEI
jgi:hypothetical protein